MSALALWAMMASNECFCMDSSSLAGWPNLRTFALHLANLSTKLSTATLEGAQHRTCTGRSQKYTSSFLQWLQQWKILKMDFLNLLALFDRLQDDLHHSGGFPSTWGPMNNSQFSLRQSKGHSFSLGIIQVLVIEFNFIWWNIKMPRIGLCQIFKPVLSVSLHLIIFTLYRVTYVAVKDKTV